jgi:lipoprotein-anchoring transpeptidase ErfK/SrfK
MQLSTRISPQRVTRVIAAIAILLVTTLVLGATTYAALALTYRDSYYPGVVVGGIDLSGKTQEQARVLLEKEQERILGLPLPMILSTAPETEIVPTLREVGVSIAADSALSQAWNVGRTAGVVDISSALQALFSGYSVPVSYTVAQDGVDAFIATTLAAKVPSPKAATITVTGDVVEVTTETVGEVVVAAELTNRITDAIPTVLRNDSTRVVVPLALVGAKPTALSLQPLAEELRSIAAMPVTVIAGNRTLIPDLATRTSWFTTVQSEAGDINLVVDEAAIERYFNKQSSTLGIEVSKAVNQVKSVYVVALAADTASRTAQRITVATKKVEVTPTTLPVLDRFAGKYVEVILSTQQAFAIENNQIVATYRVSTGKWATPTPTGTFTVTGKHPRAFSRSYGLYMPYWQNFTGVTDEGESLRAGEYGLHELPEWPSGYKEGQAHLGTAVSHGCVRFGVGDAAAMYAFTEIGTPVVVRQ